MIKKNSGNLRAYQSNDKFDNQQPANDTNKISYSGIDQSTLSFKSLSNRMRRNMKKIDLLFQNGFEVKGSVKEQTLTDPDGVPVNLWDWVPLLGYGLSGKNRSEYVDYKFPKFSWLAFLFPIVFFIKIKNWGYVMLIVIVDLIYEILIRGLGIDFSNLYESGSTIARIGIFSTIALWGFHIILGQIYPYLVWDSLTKEIKHIDLWICIIFFIIYSSLFVII